MAKTTGRTRARRAEPDSPAEIWDDEDGGHDLPPARPEPRRRKPRAAPPPEEEPRPGLLRRLRTYALRAALVLIALLFALLALPGVIDPPITPYAWSEGRRLGGIDQSWVTLDEIAPVMARAAVAAEDAQFCNHWGLDLRAIRAAMASGGDRGGSTISQQVAKNVFLWHGRSWARKAIEAGITPVLEALWSKHRILELYLNVAEFGPGIFGVEAAAQRYFGVPASDLSPNQAARLAVILPAPKERDPRDLSDRLLARVDQVIDGAATIEADGRAACFEGTSPEAGP